MLDNDGADEQQRRDADDCQLAAQPSFMLVMMLVMVLVVMLVMVLVMMLATLTLLMLVMMNMCHNFDPLNVFGCKVTAHFAQLGCKVLSEGVTDGGQHLMALVVDLSGLRHVGNGSAVEGERRVGLVRVERALRHRVLISQVEVPAIILVA